MQESARALPVADEQTYPPLVAVDGGQAMLDPAVATVRHIHRRRARTLRRLVAQASKSALDVVIAALALMITLPVILLLALLIRLESPGGALYCQTRVGRRGRHFRCFKLRTMFNDADQRLQTLLRHDASAYDEFASSRKLKDDPRVTRLGRFLRATSLDELPQLWNVLRGDMSIVGPRPLVPDELDHYGDRIHVVLQVKPGLTGIWQVSGRNDLPYPVRVALDADYAMHRTMWSDLRIIARTIPVLLFRKGAY
ncbi:MAG TPA: sugar transferase [Euzebyales bacterium]|nr:sugar transferase [Euzebyales bacterium]